MASQERPILDLPSGDLTIAKMDFLHMAMIITVKAIYYL